jgi:LysR family nitrogen assimilation transcriptional regulator
MIKSSSLSLDTTANLLRLRLFAVVAEEGSLTRAALHLDSDVAAVSRQISALEQQCGARLFNRTGRGVTLSEAGSRILPQVQALLAQALQLEESIREQADVVKGSVTLAAMPSIAAAIVGRVFTLLRADHPDIQIKVMEGASGKVVEWLADGRADIGLLYRYQSPLPPGEEALASVDAYLVGRPGDRATANETVDFRTLSSLPLVLPSYPNGLRREMDTIAKAAGVVLSPVLESDSLVLLKSLAMNEGLNVILAMHAIEEELAAGKVQAARIVGPAVRSTISIAFNKSKSPGRAVELVSQRIRKLLSETGPKGGIHPDGARFSAIGHDGTRG